MRYLIEMLVREQFGEDAYLSLTFSSPYTVFREGVRLGLITSEEYDKAAQSYGVLFTYAGD